ncbi:hypothetical protein [Zobellia sp. 1_MG-2023]|uniref:hypothetical protein n=1 Tax=Zobellia sp. 1_MG-2023 TaxID=3062626 RepID=UPI0026E2EF75|nr:hypothetical protein [Zobellia sp. 1_MG-2023]MDO6820109.1 hypothetical protein [Zobellia sp. 1_MG-2023]
METILKQFPELQFEETNSFTNNPGPCYYSKSPNGYVVFFIFKGKSVDFAVYDKTKKLISLVTAIDQSLNKDWQKQFVKYTIQER